MTGKEIAGHIDHTLSKAEATRETGAERIGTSSGVQIVREREAVKQ